MRYRPRLSLFPLLSILAGTLAAFVFVTVMLRLLGEVHPAGAGAAPIGAEWDGAPAYVRSVVLECRAEGVLLHDGVGVAARLYSSEQLLREAAIVRNLRDRAAGQAGASLSRDQEWLFFKAILERDARLKNSLALALHRIEMTNLRDESRARRLERHPILLVSPEGLDSYDLVEWILAATSRLTVAVEPIPAAWRLAAALPGTVRENRPAAPFLNRRP